MAGQDGEREPSAAGPVTDDLTAPVELAGQARRLGQQHRAAAITPPGDAHGTGPGR